MQKLYTFIFNKAYFLFYFFKFAKKSNIKYSKAPSHNAAQQALHSNSSKKTKIPQKTMASSITNSQIFNNNYENNNNNNNNNNLVSKSINNFDFFVKYSNLYPPYNNNNNNQNIYNNSEINEKNHYKSLKLFKDIKSLKNRIESDQVVF
jgi:hypothetical protein